MPSRHRRIPRGWSWARPVVMACILAALAVTALGCAQMPGRPDVVIGTAKPADIDYPLGGSICRMFNLDARGPATDLRVLFAGHAYMFTLVAHQASAIRTVADLRGQRIGIGSPGSRQRADMERVLAAFGLTRNDLADVRELSPAE